MSSIRGLHEGAGGEGGKEVVRGADSGNRRLAPLQPGQAPAVLEVQQPAVEGKSPPSQAPAALPEHLRGPFQLALRHGELTAQPGRVDQR